MLSMAGLSDAFWAEAIATSVHLINCSPSVPLGFKVPEEVWIGLPPSYGHLCVFGCKAYVHVPKVKCSKLDPKSKRCIFLGYGSSGEMGYRLWDPIDRKIVHSHDVIFHEDSMYRAPPRTVEVRRVIFEEDGHRFLLDGVKVKIHVDTSMGRKAKTGHKFPFVKVSEDRGSRAMGARNSLGSQGLEVSAQGLGCMGMSFAFGPPKPELDMVHLLHSAVNELGVTFLDTADAYGPFANELLLGKMGELKQLVKEGKIKYVGLSEASPSTIRRAHAVHPLSAVQLEWSLWSRNAETDVIPTCRELGIGIVPFSPLGRGFFSKGREILEGLVETDMRKKEQPRFTSENMEHNVQLFRKLNELASRKGCTPGQLALAWLHHQGDDVVPIPGTTRLENLAENVGALDVKLSKGELNELETVFHDNCAAGTRYGDMSSTTIETETLTLSDWHGATIL
ncbi:hypothetical protein L7F22_040716 [Adiantum nelumboides]|nr:hypothetical protein [Adiantum nelumboides]